MQRHGFTDIQVTPQARYSLNSELYLTSLGWPRPLLKPTGRVADRLIASRLAPRIVLDVYARKTNSLE